MNLFTIEYFNAKVLETIEEWPVDMVAHYGRLLESACEHGPNLKMPYSRAMGNGLFEFRIRGSSGQARALYCFCMGQRIIVLHAFRKKTRQTADHDLALARKRLKDITHG
ncbi:MAG: type II toxin-antitoxin system RelE/ParE family toxin [Rudaea sp.]